MIYSLRGTLIHTEASIAVVECGGVGFKCFTTMNTLKRLPRVGEAVTLYTHLNVREDALDLFGFADEGELSCFKMLTSVSGVGPKVALSILSETTPEQFALYAASGDAKALCRAPGVGTKLAQRIILELKDKLGGQAAAMGGGALIDGGVPSAASGAEEAVNALMVLGYARSDAVSAVAKCDAALPVEDIIRQSLRLLARA